MSAPHHFHLIQHEDPPAEAAALIDAGLASSNDAPAPLHEVRPLSRSARDEDGAVLGGAIGRSWGACCELRQLWVHPERRDLGVGRALGAHPGGESQPPIPALRHAGR